jgi:hypothetical protein
MSCTFQHDEPTRGEAKPCESITQSVLVTHEHSKSTVRCDSGLGKQIALVLTKRYGIVEVCEGMAIKETGCRHIPDVYATKAWCLISGMFTQVGYA